MISRRILSTRISWKPSFWRRIYITTQSALEKLTCPKLSRIINLSNSTLRLFRYGPNKSNPTACKFISKDSLCVQSLSTPILSRTPQQNFENSTFSWINTGQLFCLRLPTLKLIQSIQFASENTPLSTMIYFPLLLSVALHVTI